MNVIVISKRHNKYIKYSMEISQVFRQVDIHVYESASCKRNLLYKSQCIKNTTKGSIHILKTVNN